MSSLPPTTFANLLRRYRQAASLTQEELAERARLSVQAIGALERGDRRAPRKETIDLLATALSLNEPERAEFAIAARQRRLVEYTPLILTDAALSIPTYEDANDPRNAHQPDRERSLLSLPTERSPSHHLRSKLIGVIVSILIIILFGGILLKIEIRGSSLLCGGTFVLATDLPTTGLDGSSSGQSAENAVNLAITQNQNLGSGYALKVINYNDDSPDTGAANPSIGARNVQQMVKNPCVLGMVGPIHSRVALAEMPVAASAGLVMISPANTNPALTLRLHAQNEGLNFDQLHPPGKPISYFRIVGNDAIQALADATLTFALEARRVYLINNPSEYGEMLVGGFTQTFESKGGKIVGVDSFGPDPSVIPDVAARAVAARPDAIFYGGLADSGAGLLKAQLARWGYKGLFVGTDGIANDPEFVNQAGTDIANGTFASVAGKDPATITSGPMAQFVNDYAARYPGQTPAFYSAESYDAALVLITAIKHLIATGQVVTRVAIIEQVQHIQYAGVSGPISFDANGDIAHGVFSIYTVENGQWAYAWQLSM